MTGFLARVSPAPGAGRANIPAGFVNLKEERAGVAQLVERLTCNQGVASSNLAAGSIHDQSLTDLEKTVEGDYEGDS